MKNLFRTNPLIQALGAALLLSLVACSGGVNFVAESDASTPVATLTGSPLLDQAIRNGGDYEMIDAIHSDHVTNASAVARADDSKRVAGVPAVRQ